MTYPVYWIGDEGSRRLAIVARPRGGDELADELGALRRSGIVVLLCLLTPAEAAELSLIDEPRLARAAGLHFLSLPIPDMGVPPDPAAAGDVFAALQREIDAGRRVGVHCRGSVGRSSLVAATLLAGAGLPLTDAWTMIQTARGVPVPETEAQRAWVADFVARMRHVERLDSSGA